MIGFRVDANMNIATGHMFRSLSIAMQCRKLSCDCIFFLSKDSITEPIEKAGFKYEVLDLKYDDWDINVEALLEAIKRNGVDVLLIDSYKVSETFFEKIHGKVKTFYLDDFCNKRFKLDATLHYSEWEDEPFLLPLYKGTEVKTYAGMKYAPIREAFLERDQRKNDKFDLLITAGGSDSCHVIYKLLKKLIEDDNLSGLKINAVLGNLNSDEEKIKALTKDFPNIVVHKGIDYMHELMQDSRFAVTALGSTVYELMASRVFFTAFSFSDDQIIFGKDLEKHGHCQYVGDARKDCEDVVNKLIMAIKADLSISNEDYKKRTEFNYSCIDGQGAKRIAELLISMSV